MALAYTRPKERETTSHEMIHRLVGWITVGLMAVQILAGLFLPSVKVKAIYHQILRIFHWFVGGATSAIFCKS